jgi:hypothetical protein
MIFVGKTIIMLGEGLLREYPNLNLSMKKLRDVRVSQCDSQSDIKGRIANDQQNGTNSEEESCGQNESSVEGQREGKSGKQKGKREEGR